MGNRLSPEVANYSLRWWLGQMNPSWVLGPAEAKRLARHIAVKHYTPGEVILPAGSRAMCLGLVVQGEVDVLTGGQPATRSSIILKPGQSFGEEMILAGQPCNTTLQARTSCEIWFVRHDDVVALIQVQPAGGAAIPKADDREARATPKPRRWAVLAGTLAAFALLLAVTLSVPAGREAVSIVPMGLGQWCGQQGSDRCAEGAWRVAALLAPAKPDPLLALGMLYSNRGDLVTAEEALMAALALAPDWSEIHNNLGYVYASRGEYEQAIAAFRRALELEPGSAVTEYNLGTSLQGKGAHEEALAHFRSALALGEPTAELWANMAVAYFETGELVGARRAAQEAIGTGDPSASVHTVLGAIALKSGAPGEAVGVLLQAVALDRSYAPAHLYLGLAYQVLGQPDKAKHALEMALSTAEDDEMRDRIRRHLDDLSGVARREINS